MKLNKKSDLTLMNPTSESQTEGLTLIELIIVVSIIIILIFIIIAFLRGQLFKGNDAKRKADINRIKIAVEEYEKDHDCYPPPELMVCDPGTGLSAYLGKIPCDPTTKASYYYDYENTSCPSWYRIYTNLDNTSDTLAQDSCGPNGAFNYYAASPNAPDCQLQSSNGTFYGCRSGSCVPIYWDTSRPGPECDPNYQNASCYGQCGSAQTECKDWN